MWLRILLVMGLVAHSYVLHAQVIQLDSGLESNQFFIPGSTVSFAINVNNTSATETAVKMEPVLSGNYQYLGGSYPGVGGDCDTSLSPGASCTLFVETTPLFQGDHDLFMSYDYTLLSFGGAFPPPTEQTRLKVDGYSFDSSSYSLAPVITSIERNTLKINTNVTVHVYGSYFSSASSISIPGLNPTNITFISGGEMSFDINPGAAVGFYDLTLTNELDSVTVNNAIEVKSNLWVDLRIAANVTTANPVFETSRINGYNVDPSFGLQLDVATQDWRKALRFDGLCSDINKSYDIIVYRTNTVKRAMFGLTSTSLQINPSLGGSYHKRQYIGAWNTGGRVQRVYGSQFRETGGVDWNQSFTRVNTNVGMYIRYHFQNAGQNGNNIEIWEVDSNFNDISLLRSFTSTKPATPATSVCPSVVPNESGLSDYYITAIRYE